ncbi:phosphocholine-specific phospholipase C [Streptosporangium sp. NPDC000396]|uniref:phosphocholine-specific phospholipase C n=1 Tax=Streptosporangium sp. NPDC000396 TaxID=3366185 RepID=UPI0036A81A45
MSSLNRRRFMQLAGGAAALSLLPESIARAASIPAAVTTGTLQDVEHIVVLMQENRSFDHYFGMLRGVRGFGDPRPVVLPSGKPVWYQSDGRKEVLPFHPDADDLGMQFLAGLNHDWNGGHDAFNNGNYDRWIPAKTAETMAYLTRDDIPYHYALADAFTICDAYHCSFIGATDPNRYYMLTGYTGNDGTGGGPVLGNEEAGYGWTTYAERLEQAGVSWKVYQDIGDGLDAAGGWGWTGDPYIGNYGDNSLLYFNRFRNAQPGSPLYDKARTGTNVKNGGTFFDILKQDVMNGALPQVSWIAAPEAFTEHPNWPVNYGAWYIAQVLNALTANPAVWSKTVLLITYDENDGFFDHVVPPYPGNSTVSTTADVYTKSGGSYNSGVYGLGPRVPMIVVSPWSKGGWVNSQVFDHTSIIQLMEKRFGVQEPDISPWRRAICGDLTSALDFTQADPAAPALPDTSGYAPPDRMRHPDYVPAVPANPAMPRQEPGLRPARALPYDLGVTGRTDAATGSVVVDFASRGAAGATFYVTSFAGPRTYTVEAGKSLQGTWTPPRKSKGAYNLAVYGPAGFLRVLRGTVPAKGTGPADPEVSARYENGDIALVLTNRGGAACGVTVTDAYGTGATASYQLQPGASATHRVPLATSHRWYDLSVTSDADATFLRRLAGHVETGQPSMSDPATLTL